ncbi:MAG TPA: TIGR04053 family radical SAM/SPASM domain-containing protein [Solirubrobacteraceae bacterium]|nr:TIGR04053 family radical SAM/SPASM domain-containing protein [Solirubrobacteraceae bacterium]
MKGLSQLPPQLGSEARSAREERDARLGEHDFDAAPFTIAWEVTRACAYMCEHCRADAQPKRDPRELDTEEGMRLIDMLAGFGTDPILVLTGGDPLMRRDLFEFARHADERGLRVSLTPTATALPTRERMREAREAGIRRVAFSLDAAEPEVHDRFRGFQGSFDRTFKGIENALAEDLPIQVNTTMCALNVDQFEKLVPLLESVGVVQWSVFFLVPVGRGKRLKMLTAEEHERVLGRLFELTETVSFDIKATAAPHYRRIVRQRSDRAAGAGFHFTDGLDRPGHGKGVNDGRGFMFISHLGEVMPSGFLPISAGNVREQDPVSLYRDSPLFRELRDPGALRGKCGRCEFREICGGSRARAFAVTGDHLAADPSCAFQP